ncbi:glutaredoxin [Candidatus Heimdallarchaeota archaeon B3_Heim]|nr:MAG: glutaredoxin [Candidatus Heimdallarchaeota archaeon B3_Heim]
MNQGENIMSEHKVKIEDKILNEIKGMFQSIETDVTLHMFTRKDHCLLCNETLDLVQQVATQSDKVQLKLCECDINSEEAKKWKIERHPAIVVEGQSKGLIRFYGIPSGYEFGSLIESIIMSGKTNGSDLEPELVEEIKAIDKPLHLQVFVTPTCPYCPTAVLNAFKLAMLNENITADMIEATEFQELSMKYQVQGVPKTVINDSWDVVGGVPPQALMEKVRLALN